MSTPTQEYGWILIDTPEKKERFEPKLPTDEYWSEIRGNIWQVVGDGKGNSNFMSYTYRRKIDPGEGFEIVFKDAIYTAECEWECFADNDLKWSEFGKAMYGFTVQKWIEDNPNILAFRRRKSVVKESLTNGGWISVKDRLPEKGNQLISWIWNINGVWSGDICPADKWLMAYESGRYAGSDFHWMPTPPLPKAKDPADVAFDEWAKKHYGHMPMAGLSDAKCAWNARGEFERSKGQQ